MIRELSINYIKIELKEKTEDLKNFILKENQMKYKKEEELVGMIARLKDTELESFSNKDQLLILANLVLMISEEYFPDNLKDDLNRSNKILSEPDQLSDLLSARYALAFQGSQANSLIRSSDMRQRISSASVTSSLSCHQERQASAASLQASSSVKCRDAQYASPTHAPTGALVQRSQFISAPYFG